jgi:hypothetical protein
MQKHTEYAKTYRICKNIQNMQNNTEYAKKHTKYAKTYRICNNIQNMQ